jgi:hypothetical protein
VARRDAFVPEVAVDLVDALDAAHDQPLEVQLRRDAQIEPHVERIVMRDKRSRRRATRDRLHHRRLDLQVTLGIHRLPQCLDHLRAHAEYALCRFVDDQVEVALPVARFLVLQPVKFLG